MKRTWKQVKNDDGTSSLVEVPASPMLPSELRLDSVFVSPVDGTVISTKKELHDHNKRNNVTQVLPGMSEDISSLNEANRDRISGNRGSRERTEAIRRAIGEQDG